MLTPPPSESKDIGNSESADSYKLSREMQDCIRAFAQEYNSFMVLSIADDADFNHALNEYCNNIDIACKISSLGNPRYKIGGSGHLNQVGNIALSEALFEIYQDNKMR